MFGIKHASFSPAVIVTILVVGFVHLTTQVRLDLTFSPHELVTDITQNVSIRCDRQASNVDVSGIMWWFRIAKKTPDGWTDVADYNQDGSVLQFMGTSASGYVNTSDWSGYLQVNWQVAKQETVGLYRCEFFGATSSNGFDVDYSDQVNIKEGMNSDTLYQLWGEINSESIRLASCLTGAASESISLEDKVSALGRHLKEHVNIYTKISWNRGKFSLLMPDSGCPHQFKKEGDSYLKFHEESSSGTACVRRDKNLHLSKPVDEQDGSNCFIHFRFCESLEEDVYVPWPDGKYCINKLGSQPCPVGLSDGSVHLDAEDTGHEGRVGGKTARSENLYFCCKDSGSHNTPMTLPTDSDFYLYRYGGDCQNVHGMKVTQEVVEIDTENSSTTDRTSGTTADIEINRGNATKMHFCFYSKK